MKPRGEGLGVEGETEEKESQKNEKGAVYH